MTDPMEAEGMVDDFDQAEAEMFGTDGPQPRLNLDVGETATVPGSQQGDSELEVTLTGHVYFYYEGIEGYTATFAWDVANETALPATLEGSWFAWITEDGVQRNVYDYVPGADEARWVGMFPPPGRTYTAATRQEGLINEVVVEEPGGTVALIDYEGRMLASWTVPDRMSGTGFEKVTEFLENDQG